MELSRNDKILLIFPIILFVTVPIRFIKDTFFSDLFAQHKFWILQPTGPFNVIFAGSSFQIFATLFIIILVFKIIALKKFLPILPITESSNENSFYKSKNRSTVNLLQQTSSCVNISYVKYQLVKLAMIYGPIILFIVWSFGPALFDRINHWTGGHCTKSVFKYYRECVIDGHKYSNGFKTSGHSLITTTFATAILFELLNWNAFSDFLQLQMNSSFRIVHKMINVLTLSIYACWVLLFTITCLFYHTFMERLIGTSIGVGIVYTTYIKYRLS